VFGSSLTYMRRYCALRILGLAPDTDDDGKAAQERADQQARQQPPQRVEQQRSTPTLRPEHLKAPSGFPASLASRFSPQSKVDMNQAELSDLRRIRSDWAEKITAAATSTDSPPEG
jgi:hypothetical protein